MLSTRMTPYGLSMWLRLLTAHSSGTERKHYKVRQTRDLQPWKLQDFLRPGLGRPRLSLPLYSIGQTGHKRGFPGVSDGQGSAAMQETCVPARIQRRKIRLPLDGKSTREHTEGRRGWQTSWRLSASGFWEEGPPATIIE